jgi:histidinol-phosphatase (PHP family)
MSRKYISFKIFVEKEAFSMKFKDGHVHTPYCPHGTDEPVSAYIEKAIALGYEEITFTEHAPLPKGFIDPAPTRDSSIQMDQLFTYIEEIRRCKEKYKAKIAINIGLEVDYIDGWEQETTEFLNEIGPYLDDSILSVHFLKNQNDWYCLDYSETEFGHMIEQYQSVDQLYKAYYHTLQKSIISDLGTFKPKRVGHISLITKFQKKYPSNVPLESYLLPILSLIKERGYELDLNTAGLFKPLCGETYPPIPFIQAAIKMGIPLCYGSDAHHPEDLGRGLDVLKTKILTNE